MAVYTTIDNPELYFQVKTYTGNGGTLAITLDGSENMSPDFVWIKERNLTSSHALTDTVRGNTKKLKSDDTDVEETNTNLITSFDSDGFTLGDNGNANQSSSQTYVSWNWKAGTSFTNDASSTGIGSIDSTGSVNTDAGFSIVSYTGTGSAATVGHGLGSAPSVIFYKNRSEAQTWRVVTTAIDGSLDNLFLNTTDAKSDDSITVPSSTVFTIDGSTQTNKSSQNIIAYCFAEKQGYSKFGSYTGNGNADGTFVYTGFKPAFVITKASSSAGLSWSMHDNKRLGYNGGDRNLYANSFNGENTDNALDLLSNGFKSRSADGSTNSSGVTYIYMAFAENPFVTSTGVPATAR